MADYIQAWQCIGCGRVEAPQTCIGVCRDKKVFMIGKDAHEAALAQLGAMRELLETTTARLTRFALCTPRAQQYEGAYRALQRELGEVLRELRAAAAA